MKLLVEREYGETSFLRTKSEGDNVITIFVKRWLLKNGKLLYYSGILSFVLFVIILPVLLVFLHEKGYTSSYILIASGLFVLVMVILIYVSSDSANFSQVVRLPPRFVIEGFNPVTKKVTIRDERARIYVVKFQLEHYEVWTLLRRSPHCPEGFLYNCARIKFIDENFFDENLKKWIPNLREKVGSIKSLRFVRIIKGRKELKLLAYLNKKTDSTQLTYLLNLLGELAHEIERL